MNKSGKNPSQCEPILRDVEERLSLLVGRELPIGREVEDQGVDIKEDGKAYTIKIAMPGMTREDVRVALVNGLLTISAEPKEKQEKKDKTRVRINRNYGTFERRFVLPGDASSDKASAAFQEGVLRVRLPKEMAPKPVVAPVSSKAEKRTEQDTLSGVGQGLTRLTNAEHARLLVSKAFAATAQSVTKTFTEENVPTESTVLLSVINEFGDLLDHEIAEKFAADSAFEMARLRGEVSKLELLDDAGPMLTIGQVAGILNTSRQAVHKRIQNGSLFGMMSKGEFRIPAWQIREREVVSGIAKVLKNLDTTDWGKMLFLHSKNMQLEGRTPMDLILEGDADSVAEVAALFGEEGAK